MSVIGSLFGHSPIRPMQRHMHAAAACAHELLPFIDAMERGDRAEIERLHREIDRLEHEADTIKHDIRSHLPQRLFMAVERRDMLEILDYQDSVADVVQDVAELVALRGMQTPPSLRVPLRELAAAAIATCDQSAKVIDELDELIETGFGRREVERVSSMIDRLNELESEADRRVQDALRELFAIEEGLGAGSFYWYRVIEWIGDVADFAERAGNRIRLLIAS